MIGDDHPIATAVVSRRDALNLLDIIHSSLFCSNEREFNKLVHDLKTLVPFDHAVSAMAFMSRGYAVSHYEVINTSYPVQWLSRYLANSYNLIDPIVIENFKTYRVQYWLDTFKKYRPPSKFIREAGDHGLTNGYAIGHRNVTATEGSLFSFAGSDLDRSLRTEIILAHVTPHLHCALNRVLKNENDKRRLILSRREKEILSWLKEGKGTWDIAAILGISQNTVKFHLKNIFRKLNVTSRSHAVAVALGNKLIDF